MPAIFEQIMLQSFRIHYRLDQIPPWQKRIKKSCLWIWDSSQTVIGRTHPSVCPEHTWLFDAVRAMKYHSCHRALLTKNQIFCKSWKNVSQIIDFADIFPDFLYFLHFWGIFHPKNTIFCKFADKIPKKRRFCQRTPL